MNKKFFSGLITLTVLFGLVMIKPALANEGVAMLRGAGVGGACFSSSIFLDGMYRILMTCRELKTALSPEQNRYVVWINESDGKTRRLGEIVNGKLSTATDVKFVEMFVTAETDGYGQKPSDSILLSGMVHQINFDSADFKPGETIASVKVTPTPKTNAKVTPTSAQESVVIADETPSAGIGGALSTVLKIALFGFGALLLIVGVFSFISRRRSL